MKKSSFILLAVTLSVATVFTTSCKEKGCTDPDSTNYSETAEEDDGSCNYEGAVVFWYGEGTAAELGYDGVTSLTYYVDGKNIGSSDADIYWTGAPECGQNGSVGVVKSWGNDNTKTYSFSAEDQTGWVYWDDQVTFEANTCIAMELLWSNTKKK